MPTEPMPSADDGELIEQPTATRSIQELVDAGYVGFLAGAAIGAIVDPILPDDAEEPEKLEWLFDF